MLLKLVVLKKLLLAVLLAVLALLSVAGSRHYQQLPELLQHLSGSDHIVLIDLTRKAVGLGQARLLLAAAVLAGGAALLAVAALATLRHKRWGEWLLLVLLASSLPLELRAMLQQPSWGHGAALAISLLGTALIALEVRQQASSGRTPAKER